jgi:hypothetical protein
MEQERLARLQRVDEVLGARRSEADEINYCIRFERCYACAEFPRTFLDRPINVDSAYRAPRGMRHIRLALSPAGNDDVVARGDEPRDKEGADVTGSADDDNSHLGNVTLARDSVPLESSLHHDLSRQSQSDSANRFRFLRQGFH